MTILAIILLLVVVTMLLPVGPVDANSRNWVVRVICVIALVWLIAVFVGWLPGPVVHAR